MTIFHVTTEANDEGSRSRTLGYITARTKEQAVLYLYSKGVRPYYFFRVEEINIEAVTCTSHDSSNYIVTKQGSDRFVVKEKEEIKQQKINQLDKITEQLKSSGLSANEIKAYFAKL